MKSLPGLALLCAGVIGAAGHALAASDADQPLAPPCQLEKPDISINGIKIDDRESSEAKLGRRIASPGVTGMLAAVYANAKGDQFLSLFHHYGAGANEFAELEVGRTAGIVNANPLSAAKDFVSGRGVRLGMPKAKLVSIFGECSASRKLADDGELLRYEIGDPQAPLLKEHNYPLYFAEYEFKGGALARFHFGFEYP